MFRIIKRLIALLGARRKRLYLGFVFSFFHAIFVALPIVGAAYGLGLMLQDMNGEIELTVRWFYILLLFMVVMVAGRFLFSYLRAISQESIAYEVTADERMKIGGIMKRVSLGFFAKNNAGEIAGAVTTDLSFLEMFAMKMIDTVVNGYINAAVIILGLAFFSWQTALIALGGVLLSGFFLRLLGKKSRENAPVHQKAQDNMVAATIEYIRGIAVVKACKQEGASTAAIKSAFQMSKDINLKIEKNYVPYNCLHLLVLRIASTGLVLFPALLALNGTMDIPIMLMMLIFSSMMFGHVEQINNAVHVLQIIDATLDKLERIEEAAFIDADGREIALPSYGICFDNVSFAYDKRPVLRDVSFTIPENTTTAIVGPSGSGKSTICNLIARFYDVDAGRVLVGGVDVKTMTCDSLLKNISMVFQKVYLFRDTVRNNIAFGKPDATFEEIVDAAKKACCHQFIMALPDGYDTVIGDGGATLSGGEKQRISIARAMLKNAPIVILDEATASVDPENEQEIQQAISALVHGKTIIIIAHRLATISNADQILVVDEGRIVQRGNHEELAEAEGLYRRFLAIRTAAENWSI